MTQNFIDGQPRQIRTYGRTRSHGLSQTQENNLKTLYPVFGIILPEQQINPHNFFDRYYCDIYVEIGFGNGEYLIETAKKNPDIGFIGCEPFENGVVAALSGIQKNNLSNVRIYKGDARELLKSLTERSLNCMYILFPDPWRKKKHHKRRLISEDFLKLVRGRMKSGSNIVIATDHEDYRDDILKHLHDSGAIFDEEKTYDSLPGLLGTKYERKAITKGAKCTYMRVHW